MTHTSQELATFCKKKGFIYASSEIYGGVAGLYDYGHLGTKLKKNFENQWRNYFLNLADNYFEIETANIMHENVFKASGHLENFNDPVAVSESGEFERADHLIEKHLGKKAEGLSIDEMKFLIESNNIKCSRSGTKIVDVRVANMMFPISMGFGTSNQVYLRPETAQSPYVNFKLQYELLRKKLPLGLALIGRTYRNEISPRNLTLRMREFTQAELQIFFNPSMINNYSKFNEIKDEPIRTMLVEDREANMVIERTAQMLINEGLPQFYIYHMAKIQQFYLNVLKVPKEKFRIYQLNDKEKAFYNKYHFDIEINLIEHGFTEVGGLHYRTDHDLKGHQEVSKQKMEIFEESTGERFIPHVLELSFGVDRNVYSLLDLNYKNDKERGNLLLSLPEKLTPFFCSIFPLVKNKEELVNKAKEVYVMLKQNFSCYYDESSSVGRRYARADEQGVKYCITVDFESLEDNMVTIRERDSTKQERINIKELKDKLLKLYDG